MKSFDVKDAFFCVPQREELYVELGGKTYQVHYCLPGQQAASAWWGEQLAGDLKASGLSVDIACPAVLGQESSGATVHVDDGLLGGLPAGVDAVVEVLEKKYKVQVSDVVCKPGDSLRFLKKEFTVTDEGLEITLDPKYIDRVCELLNVVNPKRRRVPCSQDILSRDDSDPLSESQTSKFRGAIGSLLYVSPERPDAQFAIACLARSMSKPTKQAWRHLYALADYLWHTKHYKLLLRWTFPGRSVLDERTLTAAEIAQKQVSNKSVPMLIECLTDSDWAGAADRISTSSCHIFCNGNLAYAFVRKQGCISLSSCESELVASVSGAAEALYVAHTIRTAGACQTRLVLRMDSSSARALLFKQGVSRVRHLDTKLLWLQDYTKRKLLEPAAVNTLHNTSDLGTKPLSSKRIAFLMNKIGFNVECDVVQTIKSRSQAKLIKRVVALVAVMMTLPETYALSQNAPSTDIRINDFYLVVLTSHPWEVALVIIILAFLVIAGLVVCHVCGIAPRTRDIITMENDIGGESSTSSTSSPSSPASANPELHEGDDHAEEIQPHGLQEGDPHPGGHGDSELPQGHDGRTEIHDRRPHLVCCPRSGNSYHTPGCGNLRASNLVIPYTYERHVRSPLAQRQVCNPPLLPGSAPVRVRRRHR